MSGTLKIHVKLPVAGKTQPYTRIYNGCMYPTNEER